MIITCDIGNTSTKLGLYEGDKRIALTVVDSKQTTPFKSTILQMIYKLSLREDSIEDAIIVSTVSNLTPVVSNAVKEITKKEPIIIDQNNYYGIEIDEEVSGDVGSDILVICAYAYQKYKQELIIVSLGNSSAILHVTDDGKFKHSIIAPGFAGFASSLHLSSASNQRKGSFLASSKNDALSIGIYEGYIGMIKYLVAGMRKKLGEQIRIISCGGAAKDLMSSISNNEYYDPDFVSNGLSYIYYRYIKHD